MKGMLALRLLSFDSYEMPTDDGHFFRMMMN